MTQGRRGDARISHEGGRWHVRVRKGAERGAEALWLSLGGVGDPKIAMRLWLALLGGDDRK